MIIDLVKAMVEIELLLSEVKKRVTMYPNSVTKKSFIIIVVVFPSRASNKDLHSVRENNSTSYIFQVMIVSEDDFPKSYTRHSVSDIDSLRHILGMRVKPFF